MPALQSAVLLNDFCHVQGGASRIAVDEAVALAERSVNVTFLGSTGPVGPELANSNVKTICLGQPELAGVGAKPSVLFQGLWNATAGTRMRELLAGLDPARTVVHMHGYSKSLSTSPLRAALCAGFPVLVTLHEFFPICPNGTLYNFVDEKPCRLAPLSVGCVLSNCDKRRYAHKLYRVARSALQRWPGLLPGGVTQYIGLSRHSVALLRPHLPAASQIHQLENIIDLEPQPPVTIRHDGSLIYVGRLDPEKGILMLLEAAQRVGATLVFVGDGPLRGAVESYGRHRVTGWQTADQVQAELCKARCLLFPSRWYETYGLVVAEAAARGVPAIVSDVSAAAERVRDGVTGMVFASGDTDALARCLDATGNVERLAVLGRNAHAEFWAAPPTRESHISKLLDIYRIVLDAAARTARPH